MIGAAALFRIKFKDHLSSLKLGVAGRLSIEQANTLYEKIPLLTTMNKEPKIEIKETNNFVDKKELNLWRRFYSRVEKKWKDGNQ